jgi:hypothetical protein
VDQHDKGGHPTSQWAFASTTVSMVPHLPDTAGPDRRDNPPPLLHMPFNAHSLARTVTNRREARGRLMLTSVVRREIFSDAVSEWWVRRYVAPTKRLPLGHSTAAWYEADVLEWLDRRPNR